MSHVELNSFNMFIIIANSIFLPTLNRLSLEVIYYICNSSFSTQKSRFNIKCKILNTLRDHFDEYKKFCNVLIYFTFSFFEKLLITRNLKIFYSIFIIQNAKHCMLFNDIHKNEYSLTQFV